jgi:hypothetical protein
MRPRRENTTMDIYLPADFHELHDSVADDWRDVSSTRTVRERTALAQSRRDDDPELCADPLWCVI